MPNLFLMEQTLDPDDLSFSYDQILDCPLFKIEVNHVVICF